MVAVLLRSMSSLRQLYTMTMDVHSRYRTEGHRDITGRFNERSLLLLILLSLSLSLSLCVHLTVLSVWSGFYCHLLVVLMLL